MAEAKRKATHARHYAEVPQITDADGTKHWITRAANFVVDVTEAAQGAVLKRTQNADEYMLLLPPGSEATIEARGETLQAGANSLTIVPPGDSRVTVRKAGQVVRVFSNKAADMTAASVNAATYADGAPEITPITPWPDPARGFRLHHYALDKIPSPDPTPLKMRVFRSTNLMINIFLPWPAPRDESKLSPHYHDDFEQISLGLQGEFMHHLRYPWGPNKAGWIEDEHEHYGSPSVLVIPANVLHTSQNVSPGTSWLIDIFGPPRMDFSLKPGFVINAADYPMPTQA